MIASWMLYAAVVSVLITVAALAADQALTARRLPTRFVWFAALILSAIWPVGSAVRRLFPETTPVLAVPFTIVVQGPAVLTRSTFASRFGLSIERGLIALWVVLSLALLLRLAVGVISLRRMRAAWQHGRVEGIAVKLSDNIGPAVVGLRTMDVVLPSWILTLDSPLRAIVLRHEEEHRRARDPYLLFSAAIVVALMPWNLLLWAQAKRLRLAIEIDCDARVLRVHPSPERYGMLMLTIAQRRSIAPTLFAPMLTEPITQLERRIQAMRTTTRKLRRLTMYGGGAVAVLLLAFATSLQSATVTLHKVAAALPKPIATAIAPVAHQTAVAARPAARVTRDARVAVDSPEVRTFNKVIITRVRPENPAPRYPDLLRSAGVEGAVVARFQSDDRGYVEVSSIEIIRSTHELFSAAVKSALQNWQVRPNSSYQMPFLFVMQDKTGQAVRSSGSRLTIDGVELGNGTVIVATASATAEPPAEPQRMNADQTFFEFQVEKQATPMRGNPAPRYPDELRKALVEGEVLVQFVLNTDGTPDMATLKVLRSDHVLFTDAVRSSLPDMRFYPAQVGGRAVKQLVQMPFQFNLTKQ